MFGNLKLNSDVVYLLTTKNTEEITLNSKNFIIEANPSVSYRFSAKPFRLSRLELDEAAQLEMGGLFSDLTLHPTVNSILIAFTALIYVILNIVILVRRNHPVATFAARVTDYTIAPQAETSA